MQIKDYRCACGSNDFFLCNHIPQVGIYCSRCGSWYKWANKDEKNLKLIQENTIDNIVAEIKTLNTVYATNITYVSKNDVLNIINKYKNESED